MIDWLIDWLIDRLIDWLIDWLSNCELNVYLEFTNIVNVLFPESKLKNAYRDLGNNPDESWLVRWIQFCEKLTHYVCSE